MRIFLIFPLLLLTYQSLFAQDPLQKRIDFQVEGENLPTTLLQLSKQAGISISFNKSTIPNHKKISLSTKNRKVGSILKFILAETDLGFQVLGKHVIVKPIKQKTKAQTASISGFITHKVDGERIVGATIYSPTWKVGTHSNEYGFYSLSLPLGETELNIQYIGSPTKSFQLNIDRSRSFHVELENDMEVEEVLITSADPSQDRSKHPKVYSIRTEDIQLASSLGGEKDILHVVRTLPGVQAGPDGLGGMHIRGGNNGQNLMLLDGVPIYNPSHLLGILSVYDPNAIRSAKLMTGAFPARYGGRLSSVLDVHTREGNQKKLAGEVGMGLISGNINLEGPINKGKGSFFISTRRSLFKFLLNPNLHRAFAPDSDSLLQFAYYDLNAKINYHVSPSDRIYLSLYNGGDLFLQQSQSFEEEFTLGYESALTWGNTASSLRWNHIFSSKLFSNTSITYSLYKFDNSEFIEIFPSEEFDFDIDDDFGTPNINEFNSLFFNAYQSRIEDLSAKVDFHYYPNPNHEIRFGAGLILHEIDPAANTFSSEDEAIVAIDSVDFESLQALVSGPSFSAQESYVYAEDEILIDPSLYINLGVRFSNFQIEEVSYISIEPRLALQYKGRKNFRSHVSLSRMVQYLHQISLSGLGLPNDVWLPSTSYLQPQIGLQIEGGIAYSLPMDISLQLDGYYKDMKHLYTYESFGNIDLTNPLEMELIEGSGNAYGLEVMAQRSRKNAKIYVNYALSWANRRFELDNDGINYAYEFDQRHRLNFFFGQELLPHLHLGVNWQFNSGRPKLILEGNSNVRNPQNFFWDDENKNIDRSAANHRLDINLDYKIQQKNVLHKISAGIYNVYNRKNVAFYRFPIDEDNPTNLKPIHLLPMTPSLSYGIRF